MVTFLCLDMNSWASQEINVKRRMKGGWMSEETQTQKKKGNFPCGCERSRPSDFSKAS
jgi:hypothetical protein